LLNRPILWYGAFFALGFFLAYAGFVKLVTRKVADQISSYILVGTVIGARLFDVLFYEKGWHVLAIFRFWESGLSSHGAVIGLILAVCFYQRKYRQFTLLQLLDRLSIVAGVAAACIRIGNFFNQEILGTLSTLPWAVMFGHPADGSFPAPRHPVQLYEALYYLLIFGVMWRLRKQLNTWREGRLCGLFLTLIFGFRLVIEVVKEEQSLWNPLFLTMGQWLTLPFLVFGLFLLLRRARFALLR